MMPNFSLHLQAPPPGHVVPLPRHPPSHAALLVCVCQHCCYEGLHEQLEC